MSDYKKIVELALLKSRQRKTLNEGVVYPDNISERIHPKLEKDLINQKHSLGKHPAFPESDESTFEEKIIGQRFSEVCKRYKRVFDVESIDNDETIKGLMPMVYETIALESKHTKELEKLAIKMIREEYDMDEDVVEIIAELTPNISLEGRKLNEKPEPVEGVEFDSHDDIVKANAEVYKRRFINAMIQGASKKCNHMFHLVDDELMDINPRLPNKYSRLMSTADYSYYIMPDLEKGVVGGVVNVEFPTKDNPKAKIHAQAMVFPVLIHEIVKGVMELLSAHGLPKEKKLGKYVISKADFIAAEPWDMRLGPALWGKFTELIDADDFNLKHHIYSDLVQLPAHEFHKQMKEIMSGTKQGKKIIKNILDAVKHDLQQEEFTSALDEINSGQEMDDEFDEFL